jgi:hypothetical protein
MDAILGLLENCRKRSSQTHTPKGDCIHVVNYLEQGIYYGVQKDQIEAMKEYCLKHPHLESVKRVCV